MTGPINKSGAFDVKMGGSFLEGKSSFKMLVRSFFEKLDWPFCSATITINVGEFSNFASQSPTLQG